MEFLLKMTWILIFFISLSGLYIEGLQCPDLNGQWYNQLGSEVILTKNQSGVLTGEYRTAVEKKIGAAGNKHAVVRGLTADESSNIFGFSTAFKNGNSAASWIGQCMNCDGITTLESTWLLRVQMDTCEDEWKSTMIGEDIFSKEDEVPGPRKSSGTDTPKRPKDWVGNDLKGEISDLTKQNGNIYGKWHAPDGMLLELTAVPDIGKINGTLTYPVESPKKYELTGVVAVNEKMFGLSLIDGESKAGAVLVGQYYAQCGGRESLETSWLQLKPRENCSQKRRETNFSKMRFTRTVSMESGKTAKPHISTMFSTFSKSVTNFFHNLFG